MFINKSSAFSTADFEKRIYDALWKLENDINQRFSSLENRTIKIEVKLDHIFDEQEFKHEFFVKLKNELIKIGLFALSMSLIIILAHFHIVR